MMYTKRRFDFWDNMAGKELILNLTLTCYYVET